MANIKSAQKRIQVAARNRKRNISMKSAIRTALKKVDAFLKSDGSFEDVVSTVNKANSLIDRAILKGILHKKTGSRMKSRLHKRVNAAQSATA